METYKQPLLSTALAASLTCGFALLGDGEMTILPPLMREILAGLCFLIALGILVWLFLAAHRSRKNKGDANDIPMVWKSININVDFNSMNPKLITAFLKQLKDMSSAQIEALFGGHYATEVKKTRQKDDSPKEKGKESGEAQDN